jgi:hypothetical protein
MIDIGVLPILLGHHQVAWHTPNGIQHALVTHALLANELNELFPLEFKIGFVPQHWG